MSRHITPGTTLENLKREAKRWLKALRADVAEARARLERSLPHAPAIPTLRDVQHALAIEFGLPGWTALKERVGAQSPTRRYERVAEAVVIAYRTPDPSAMRIVWEHFGHRRTWDAMRRYMRLDLGKREQPESPDDDQVTLAEAQYLVARSLGFDSWRALTEALANVPPAKARTLAGKVVGAYSLDAAGAQQIAIMTRDWDELEAFMRDNGTPGLHASGEMTDELLERFARVESITDLDLSVSNAITDDGLRHLARLPRLRHVNLSGCSRITDSGLEVFRRTPTLESVELAWTRVTDAGVAHLGACERLQCVNLGDTATGDGAIRALAGKSELHTLRSGNGVTDAGLLFLHELPVFKQWQGGESRMALLSPDARPNFLSLRGTFTDSGFARLVGLDGLFALDVDNSKLAITGAALAPLVELPHLSWLAFDAKDDSMPYIAMLPHLRFLLCQDTTAGDDGFVALSKSRTIEHIWGRRCYNLRRRGFMALADMPALGYLSVSCKNVDDVGLSALPRFPALRELMPMDVPDEGYRHVAQCGALESLVLMYCRDTTDAATRHITRLATLRKYFASYTRITDVTPELLSGMPSLEEITFDSCAGLTDAGIASLVRLPRLRELRVSGMPNVTRGVATAFSDSVKVRHTL